MKSWCLIVAAMTLAALHPLLYMKMTKHSIRANAQAQQCSSQGSAWEPLVRRWDQVCFSILFMLHPCNIDIVTHPVKICERVSANGWTGQYLSRWYGLVCRRSFIWCLATVRTCCCKTSLFASSYILTNWWHHPLPCFSTLVMFVFHVTSLTLAPRKSKGGKTSFE